MDSRSLSLFLAVADALSFRQAAETLHMSQPPLSRAIRELEDRLGTRLFERSTQGVALTEAGRTLVPFVRDIERLLQEAEARLVPQGLAMRIRIGLTNAVEPAWFGKLAERLQMFNPETTVSITIDSSPRLVKQLRAGKLEAAFIALPTETSGFDVRELDRLPMMVAMPSNHRLTRRKRVRLLDLAAEPLFWFERARQPAFYDHCQRIFARHSFSPPKLKEPVDHHVLLAEVAAGRGVSFLPASFAELKRAGVVYRQLIEGDELAVHIGLATPKNRLALRDLLLEGLAKSQRSMDGPDPR